MKFLLAEHIADEINQLMIVCNFFALIHTDLKSRRIIFCGFLFLFLEKLLTFVSL